MRLSALFEEFTAYLKVERGASAKTVATYRRYFGYFQSYARLDITSGPVLVEHFTPEVCRQYQYSMASRELQPNSVRVRLAVLASFAKWGVRSGRLARNPMENVVLPKRKARLPRVPRWQVVERFLDSCPKLRDKALVSLMVYGGLRRAEVVALNVGDYDASFGLRKVRSKGGHESTVPLPEVARKAMTAYLKKERPDAKPSEPMFLVKYKWRGGEAKIRRMAEHRVWKLIKHLGKHAGLETLHPHAFRHACAVELLRRTRNLRAVQEYLRHLDIQTTTVYTKLLPEEMQQIASVFDRDGSVLAAGDFVPPPEDGNSGAKTP